ncbi:cytochrome P450 [Colletotrichum filicis]|nr:cytochrome P450 [Colletotrichum filicis]
MSLPRYASKQSAFIDGYFIPKNSIVACNSFSMHRLDERDTCGVIKSVSRRVGRPVFVNAGIAIGLAQSIPAEFPGFGKTSRDLRRIDIPEG